MVEWRLSLNASSPAPPAIDGIQNAHHLLGRFRLRDRKEIFGVIALLAKVDQEQFGLAVFKAWPAGRPQCSDGSVCHPPNLFT